MKPTFAIGDRVALDPPRPGAFSQVHGIVVYYHGRNHAPRNPRVRWDSGWGTSCNADHLRLLTPEETAALPIPQRIACDFKTTEA